MTAPYDPRNFRPNDFLEWAAEHGMPPVVARRWIGEVLIHGALTPDRLIASGRMARRWASLFQPLPQLTVQSHLVSPRDGFEKLLFETHDGMKIETVLIPLHKDRCVSLCLSSQVGCVMGCVFCATARMETRRNLAAWEIVDQFVQARRLAESQGRRVTGAVFMGMGEPFLNYSNVLTAATLLHYPLENAISGKAITISTVGLTREIDRFISERHPYRLSISLNAATDEKRTFLVPVAARTPVAEVMEAARRYAAARRDRVNIAYVCIRGVNVSVDDARALADLVGDTPIRLDLIDVTDHSGRFEAPTADELNIFRDALARYLRQPVARRYSGGADIRASCGALAGLAVPAASG